MGVIGRHLASIVVAVAVLAAPAAASAKEISEVSICGAGGRCTTYEASDSRSLMFLADDAGPTHPPAAAAPWYRVRFTVDEREHGGGYARWVVAYVPSAASLRVREDSGAFAWVGLKPRAAAALERAVRDLPAFPEARLRGLHVETPRAKVDAVFRPSATRAGIDSGTPPWGWIAGAALVAALVLLMIARTRRRSAELSVQRPRTGQA